MLYATTFHKPLQRACRSIGDDCLRLIAVASGATSQFCLPLRPDIGRRWRRSPPSCSKLPSTWIAEFRVAGERAVAGSFNARTDIRITVHEDLAEIEQEWRAFERRADGTVFQTYEWLSTWQRHIGARRGVRPAVVIARDARGEILHAAAAGDRARHPVGAPDLARPRALRLQRAAARPGFFAARQSRRASISSGTTSGRGCAAIRGWPSTSSNLEQMPETLGAQRNPMLHLGAAPHRDCAYLVSLADSWEKLYAKRSSATRRHDRSKRHKLAEHGAVRFVSAAEPAEIMRDARNADDAEGALVRRHGRRRHVRASPAFASSSSTLRPTDRLAASRTSAGSTSARRR